MEPRRFTQAQIIAILKEGRAGAEVGPVFVETLLLVKEESTKPRTHEAYPPEIRRRMVELVRARRDLKALAREFEPTAQSIVIGWCSPTAPRVGETMG